MDIIINKTLNLLVIVAGVPFTLTAIYFLKIQKKHRVSVASGINIAGCKRRFLAYLIDLGLCLSIFTLFSKYIIYGVINEYLEYLSFLLLMWLYFALFESSSTRGALGKIFLNISVVDYSKRKLSFSKSSVRFFLFLISCLSLGLGNLMACFTGNNQTAHDVFSNTLVMKKDNIGNENKK